MPTPTRPFTLAALLSALALLASPAHAAMQALDNQALSEVTGQSGVSMRVDLKASINKISWIDDGASVSLRNVKIDNGCLTAADCRTASGGSVAYGAAQLGLSIPALNIDVPTLQVDVVKDASGKQQLQLVLPNLTAANEALDPLGARATIRLRVAGDMYIGENRLGTFAIRDITDIHGTIKVWGH